MKKIFLTVCTVLLLAGCGTGNEYADKYISACKDAIGTYENAADLKELDRAKEDFRDNIKALDKDYEAEQKEIKRGIEDFDEDVLDVMIKTHEAEADADWAYAKRKKELKDAE